ncbi:MAG: ThiF family adenylyltransferase [Anaeromyxobacter sp.]
MALSEDRIARYARQLLVPGLGEAAQELLLGSRVRAVGASAVAGPGLVYLVQAGVGRLWLDDHEDVGPADAPSWLYPPSAVGRSRVEAARQALGPLSEFVLVDRYPVGGVPSGAFICAASTTQALQAAEEARRAGIPHVVVEADGEGGSVVSVPPGAPCFACARSVTGAGRPPLPGAGALAAVAASELILMLTGLPGVTGRRIELIRGAAMVRPTQRLAGCVCAGEPAKAPEA